MDLDNASRLGYFEDELVPEEFLRTRIHSAYSVIPGILNHLLPKDVDATGDGFFGEPIEFVEFQNLKRTVPEGSPLPRLPGACCVSQVYDGPRFR